ncbi:MAG TPA: hypothetical protein VFI03_03625 [Solirubrobacterales bacterium]|nr:hypothetical protein [Solirubrobacterales bacterium]
MAVLLAKLLLAPACVVAVSLAGRRWGMAVAGILGGLPVVAGPILVVLTLVHGPEFGAKAAAGTLLGLAALTLFVVVYGKASERSGPTLSLLAGWAAFLLGVAILQLLDVPPGVSLAFVAACFAVGLALFPGPTEPPTALTPPPWWDLPARGLAALALAVALTAASGALGPSLSGLLAPFPVITSVLAVFTHIHDGVGQVRVLLRNFLVGFYGFAVFCFVLASTLDSLSGPAAFSIALAAALATQATIYALSSRRLRPQAAEGSPEANSMEEIRKRTGTSPTDLMEFDRRCGSLPTDGEE